MTTNRTPALLLGFTFFLLLAAAVACGGSKSTSVSDASAAGGTRSDDDDKVTVSATWDGKSDPLRFDVALNTHSVNLDSYDLAKLSLVRTDRGEARPSAWDAPKGGHHRSGVLTFEISATGTGLGLGAGASYMELVVRDVGGKAERVLRWDLTGASRTNAK